MTSKYYTAILFGIMIAFCISSLDLKSYFQPLAQAFLNGKLYIDTPGPDLSPYNGHWYYPDGPLPAVVLMPFVALGINLESFLWLIINIAVFSLCFILARRYEYSQENSCWLAIAFCFGSSFVSPAIIPWGFAPNLVVLCLFATIFEYETKRRLPVIGLLIGLAAATRNSAGVNIVFFTLATALSLRGVKPLIKLLTPFIIIVCLLALYNYARFGDFLENGYSMQVATNDLIPFWMLDIPGNIPGPVMSLSNIPHNLAVFLFGLPSTSAIGTSVFLMSPYLPIYLWRIRWDLSAKLATINIVMVLITVLSFHSTGSEQIGYRFSLDFLPFVYWMIIRSQLPITKFFRNVIAISTLINLTLTWYFLSTTIIRRGM